MAGHDAVLGIDTVHEPPGSCRFLVSKAVRIVIRDPDGAAPTLAIGPDAITIHPLIPSFSGGGGGAAGGSGGGLSTG